MKLPHFDIQDLYDRGGPMRSRLRTRGKLKIAVVIVGGAALACFLPVIFFLFSLFSPAKMEVSSPSGVDSVICAHDKFGFGGSDVWFSVRDRANA